MENHSLHPHWGNCLTYFVGFEAGLVGLVLFRDIALVGGAVYKRASNLGWKVRSASTIKNKAELILTKSPFIYPGNVIVGEELV